MPDTILLLGPIVFQDFEVPEKINFGGAQRLAIHQLPGGARIIDTLGRDDADISFSGIFTGEDATLRARALDELRALGLVVPLTWDVFTYSVVIKDFTAEYTRPGWIPFRIVCSVLRDEAAALIEAPLALATAVLGDFSIVSSLALTAGISLAGVSAAFTAPSAMVRGTQGYAIAATQLGRARDDIAAGIGQAEARLDPDAIGASGIGAADNLNRSADALAALSSLTMARAYAGRAAINLANAST